MAIVLACGLVTLVCVGAGSAVLLSRGSPAWWGQAEPSDGQGERGRRVEEAVSRLLSAAEPGMTTRTALLEADANAWLATRLPRWLEAEEAPWPAEVSVLRLRVAEGVVHMGVQVSAEGWERVVSLTLRPYLDDQGRLWTPAVALRVGRLRVPVGWVLDGMGRSERLPERWREDPRTAFALQVFAGRLPLVERPVVRLDERRLRLTRLELTPGRFELEYGVELKR